MSHPRIPEGWEYVTSDPSVDDAWRLACDYKQLHEKVNGGVFIRVRVIRAAHVFWVIRRVESREERDAA